MVLFCPVSNPSTFHENNPLNTIGGLGMSGISYGSKQRVPVSVSILTLPVWLPRNHHYFTRLSIKLTI